jgi:phage/plasmid-like protein (TIGR03299 family)
MAHELDKTKNGRIRMAYNDRQVPWHRLGTPMKGLQTMEAMLEAASANYDVVLTKVAAVDDSGELIRNSDGSPIVINDSRATLKQDFDGSFHPLATVGTRYEVRQNSEVLERALAVVGASKGDAVVDTCGCLKGGSRFFATIDLGPLVVDASGVNDKLDRYLVISAGHDGVWPIRYSNTEIRAVCNNTVVLGEKTARRVFTARHTRNMDTIIEDAQEVLEISTRWADEFTRSAEQLLSIKTPVSSVPDSVLKIVAPYQKAETKRQREHRSSIEDAINSIYKNERNAAGYGYNAWSVYNAVCEYLDHYRFTSPEELAIASMDENSSATKKKLAVQRALLGT